VTYELPALRIAHCTSFLHHRPWPAGQAGIQGSGMHPGARRVASSEQRAASNHQPPARRSRRIRRRRRRNQRRVALAVLRCGAGCQEPERLLCTLRPGFAFFVFHVVCSYMLYKYTANAPSSRQRRVSSEQPPCDATADGRRTAPAGSEL
jgi:hypothetical protein